MCAYISNYLTILDLVPIPTLPVRTLSSYGIIQVSNSLLLYNKNIGTIFEQEDMIMHLAEAVAAQVGHYQNIYYFILPYFDQNSMYQIMN